MLSNAKRLEGFILKGRDGEIGSVRDFLFDDKFWAVRYLIAETGSILASKLVLISPHALATLNESKRQIEVDLDKDRIENSPPLESQVNIIPEFERLYHLYYGWPPYWTGPYVWGTSPDLIKQPMEKLEPAVGGESWDPHLRSIRDLEGQPIQASDGEIGQIVDFILQDKTWVIRYLVVDTRHWLPGGKVLISPQWIDRISWQENKVFVSHTRDEVKRAPAYHSADLLTRAYEVTLHGHYDRKGYWIP